VASDTATDSDLVAQTLGGDAGAFEVLVRRHYRAAFSIALAHTAHKADAEDVCHDAFVRASAKLGECRTSERFAYWLCAIVRNHARNVLARGVVRRAEPLAHDTIAARDDPSRDVELLEYMELLAVFEASSRRLLPAKYAGMAPEELDHRLRLLRATVGNRR